MFFYNPIFEMKRTGNYQSLSHLLFRSTNSKKGEGQSGKEEELTVKINLAGRQAMTLKVPARCNMKILKSMLLFHLKKTLPANELALIVGFESQQGDYQLDFLLQNGLGVLQNNLFLTCLEKTENKTPRSILNYKICKLLSVGGFSKVYLLRDRSNGQFRAGKFIVKQKLNQEMVQNEFQLSAKMAHPFVLQTYDLIETEHFYVFVLQFYPGGELFELMKRNRHMREENARFYIVEALLALRYIHERSIVFRDIKPENILLDQQGHLRLVDFGLAKKINHRSYSFCGSLDYMAPEIIRDEGHSFEADYYAIGNLLFEILVGSPPFYHPKFSAEETKFHILNTEVRFPQYLSLSRSVVDLMSRLLRKDPTERLGFVGGIDAIFSHEWFSDVNVQDYMNKLIEPPIRVDARLTFFDEPNTQEKQMWDALLEKDVKQETLREAIRTTKTAKGNRHRSLNSQKSCDDKETQSEVKQGRVNAKLKTNMCLLYVLTHKRVSSECPNSPPSSKFKKSPNYLPLKSSLNGRKSSVLRKSHNKLRSCLDSPVGEMKCNWLTNEKEGTIKKRRKENQPFLKPKR